MVDPVAFGQLPNLGPGRTIRVTAESMDAIGRLRRGGIAAGGSAYSESIGHLSMPWSLLLDNRLKPCGLVRHSEQ